MRSALLASDVITLFIHFNDPIKENERDMVLGQNKEKNLERQVCHSLEAECEAGEHEINQDLLKAAPCLLCSQESKQIWK